MSDWEPIPKEEEGWEPIPTKPTPTPSQLEAVVRSVGQGITADYEDEIRAAIMAPFSEQTYEEIRDEIRNKNAAAKTAHPKTYLAGEVVGGLALPGLGVAKGATTAAKIGRAALAGAAYGSGASEADNVADLAIDTGKGAVFGAGAGVVADKVIAPALSRLGKSIKPTSDRVADYLRKKSGKLTENATGATRFQAEKFADGAGEQLQDMGIVPMGSTPIGIAKRATEAQAVADATLDRTLVKFDEMGVKATPDEVLGALKARVEGLYANPGTAPDARQLERMIQDVAYSMKGNSQPLSVIEGFKRSYKKAFKNPDPTIRRAAKEAYWGLMETTEKVATRESPELADAFMKAKKTHGLLDPIIDAAEKRAEQLKQHPILGLNDIATAGTGAVAGDPTFGLASMALRRTLAPRIPSTAAGLTNLASKGVRKLGTGQLPVDSAVRRAVIPGASMIDTQGALKRVADRPNENENEITRRPQSFSPERALPKVRGTRFERQLNDAIQRGQDSFGATYYLLSRDPEFRKLMEEGENK